MFSIILMSCGNNIPANDKATEINQDSIEYENAVLEEFKQQQSNRDKWLELNTIPKNKLLINFSTSSHTREHNELNHKHCNEINKLEFPDSIVATFCKRIAENCKIMGNISVNSDTIKLLYNDICSPFDTPCKCGAFMKFKYVIKKTNETAEKDFIAENHSLLKN